MKKLKMKLSPFQDELNELRKFEDDLKDSKIKKLEEDLHFFKTKCKNLETEQLNSTSELTVEFYERVKRLKTEITAS